VPTYQYTCTDCGEPVEAVQKFTDEPLSVCAACGGRLRKVFSPVGIVFKGSGFYRTDSRNGSGTTKGKQSSESAPAAQSSEPAAGTSGSAEKKPSDTASAPAKSASSSGEKVA
jgi:putative FmdB family regulatory protein